MARETISRAKPKCNGKFQLQQYMDVFSPQMNVIAGYITQVVVTSDPSLTYRVIAIFFLLKNKYQVKVIILLTCNMLHVNRIITLILYSLFSGKKIVRTIYVRYGSPVTLAGVL